MNLVKPVSSAVGSEDLGYPQIMPVSATAGRPFWSVMVPVYNRTRYIEQALRSVLAQDPGPDQMQIEVVDDRSTIDGIAQIVQALGQGRVSFYQQPRNVGLSANWNTCIRRARGYWVHILHDDDFVLPGFYARLQEAVEHDGSIGAAFSRYLWVDADGHWQEISHLERPTPGVLSNWIEHIAVSQRIQSPAIVVRRSVYETLGGFHPGLFLALDWDMWKKIAVRYPVWYEPQPLACYRSHSAQETLRLLRSGAAHADTRHAIEIARTYLPPSVEKMLTRRAREHCTVSAVYAARRALAVMDVSAAAAQLREGLKFGISAKGVEALLRLLLWSVWSVVRLAGRGMVRFAGVFRRAH